MDIQILERWITWSVDYHVNFINVQQTISLGNCRLNHFKGGGNHGDGVLMTRLYFKMPLMWFLGMMNLIVITRPIYNL